MGRQEKRNIVPGDQIGNNLTGIARSVRTRKITLSGSKVEVVMPDGCFEVNIKAADGVSEFMFYESASTYTVDGITYGDGYNGSNMTFPVWGKSSFHLSGTGDVYLAFSNIKEV